MTIPWDFEGAGKPSAREIVDRLEETIRNGELDADTQLPTQRAIADQLGVSLGTVGRAIAEAQRRGLVRSTVGRGTFIRSTFEPLSPVAPVARASSGEIELGFNTTFPLPLEREALSRTLTEIAADRGLDAHPNGIEDDAPYADVGWRWLEPLGFARSGTSFALAASAQNAILSIVLALARPGDSIAHGTSIFPGVRSLAERLRCPLLEVEEDEDGPLPGALADALEHRSIALLYLTPTVAPVGNRCISEARRRELVELAREFAFVIVEDEDDGALIRAHPPRLQSLAPDVVVAVVETSKSFASGSRLAFVVAPESQSRGIAVGNRVTTWNAPWLPVEVAKRWILDGTAAAAADARRAELAHRQGLVRAALDGVVRAPVLGPDDAHTAWVELDPPWTSEDAAAALRARGVHVEAVGTYTRRERAVPAGLRLCLGAETRARLADGLAELERVLRGPYRPARLSSGA